MSNPGKPYWECPELWPRADVFIIGGGPSIKEMDLTPIHSKRVIGCNDAYTLGDWVDVCYFGDQGWFTTIGEHERRHCDALAEWAGLVVCSCVNLRNVQWLKIFRRMNEGISMKSWEICWNSNTGASAINLAAKFGAARVILLGFDMKLGGEGQANWHVNNKNKPNKESYERFLRVMTRHVVPAMERLEIPVLNATPDSAMDLFPKVKLEDVL